MNFVFYLLECVVEAASVLYGLRVDSKKCLVGILVVGVVCGIFILSYVLLDGRRLFSVLLTIGIVVLFIGCSILFENVILG